MSAAAAAAPRRLRWRSSILAALVVTLSQPSSWAFGLAGFLAGGGIILVAWPIVVLPTPTGLQNLLGAPVSTLVFGGPSAALILLVVGAGLGVVVAVLLGTWIGAWAELQGIRSVLATAAEEGIVETAESGSGLPAGEPAVAAQRGTGSVAAVRLLSLVPVLAAAALAWGSVYDAAYRELILPSELVTPLPLRVIREVPGPLAAVLASWLLSDAAAAVAVRRLVLDGRSPVAAWLLGWAALVRRPHRVLATELIGLVALGLLVAPPLAAAAAGWTRVRDVMVGGGEPVAVFGLVIAWVAVWLGGLVLAGVGTAFRGAAWTLGVVRR